MKNNNKVSKPKQNPSVKEKSAVGFFTYAIGIMACVSGIYFSLTLNTTNSKSVVLALEREVIQSIGSNISCSEDYKHHPTFDGCTPKTICGRVVRDNLVTNEQIEKLVNIAKKGFAHGGSSGGASILDLHSGALSKGKKFINIFAYLTKEKISDTFKAEDFHLYSEVKAIVHEAVANEFGIDPSKLYLTYPTFFSAITNNSAKTHHDEYWHTHIDKIQYGSFDYTSLLYLTSYKKDFEGGRFIFDEKNNETMIIEPKRGRLSYFTSGSENPHHVEKVTSGIRYAMTISFTCDPQKAIEDPSFLKLSD